MFLNHWISSLVAGRAGSRRGRTARSSASFRSSFERLEDRCVPADLSVAPAHVYDFNGSLADRLGGPTLASDGGALQAGRYVFGINQGLRLTGGLTDPGTYSIVMRCEIDALNPTFKKLIDFSNRTSDGLYVAGANLRLYPGGSGVSVVTPNVDFVVTVTRDGATGVTKMYFNNVLEQTYGAGLAGVTLPTSNVLSFFEDDWGGGEAVGGSVDYLATFNGVLTDADVALVAGAALGVTTNQPAVGAPEGQTAYAAGTWSSNGVESVSLTASAGVIVKNPNGTWSWSGAAADGPAGQTVTVTATDSDGASVWTSFNWIVDNVAPSVAAAAGSVVVAEGGTASMTGTWSDPGLDGVTPSASSGVIITNANGTWSWSAPAGNGPASRTVTITATDSDGASRSTGFVVSVDNVAPVVGATSSSISAEEGQTATVSGTWSDAGGDDVTLTASVGSVVKNANATWVWTGVFSDSQVVTITATDGDGASSSVSFTLTVTNLAPTAAPEGLSVTVTEGEVASLRGTWSDPGADDVILSASVGVIVQNPDGTWAWDYSTADGPDDSQTVTITATDSEGASSLATFELIVSNAAPTVAAAASSASVVEGEGVSLGGTWSDPGADVVTLTASVGVVVQNDDGTWSWSYTTSDGPDDSQTVTITATDSDGAASSTTFALTVTNVAPYVAAAPGSATADEGGTAAMSGTWSDPGADIVTLSASVGSVVKNADGTWSWSFATSDGPDDSQTVTITATDSDGASRSTSFSLTVLNVAPSVAANAGSVTVNEGGTASLSGTWSDPGLDVVTLSASVGSVVKNADGTWSWSFATSDGPDDSQTVTITATDSDGDSTSTTFALTVANVAPSVAADAGSVTVNEGGAAAVSGTWSDPGLDVVTLSASVGSVVKNADGSWSWSYSTADGPDDSQTVTITATDSDGDSTSTTFALTVTNVAPYVAAAPGSATANEGGTAAMSGTWSDPGADIVTPTPSVGSVVKNADGTWSWSFATSDGPDDSRTVTITATDSDGASSATSFALTVTNVAPSVAANAGSVTVNEGGTASMSGTWSDPGLDVVTLSASVGSVVKNADGSWSWSFATSDGPDDNRTVTITATDSDGASSSTSFSLTVLNVAPSVAANAGSVAAPEGGTASMSGTWSDPGLDVVTLTASSGSVVKNANGTWSWSGAASASQTVTITATDSDGASRSTNFALTVTNLPPSVAASASSVTAVAGSTAAMSGTWSDPGADVVTLTASSGSVVKNANGTWSWSGTTSASQTVTITATDSDGASASTTFALTVTGNQTPQITQLESNAPAGAPSDGAVTLEGAFANNASKVKVKVDWGDGSKSEWGRVDQRDRTFQGKHEYASGGVFTITVTLQDERDVTVTRTTTAVVAGAGIVNGTLQVVASRPAEDVRIERVMVGSGRNREECFRIEIHRGEGRNACTEVYTFRCCEVRDVMVMAPAKDCVKLGKGVTADVVIVPNRDAQQSGSWSPALADFIRQVVSLLESLFQQALLSDVARLSESGAADPARGGPTLRIGGTVPPDSESRATSRATTRFATHSVLFRPAPPGYTRAPVIESSPQETQP